jgi:glycosyltransferase involved in cell wall biosynthesis
MQNSDVSVVILTKNSAWSIGRCLESVIGQRPKEIIAVDMLSTDETHAILVRYGAKVLTHSLGSLGYSRKVGVEVSKGVYIMFVDSDVQLTSGCIARLRSNLKAFAWAGVSARILGSENSTYWQRSEDANFELFINRPGPRPHIGMGASLFQKDLLLRYPFDPAFSECAEDIDVCRRLIKANYQVGVSGALAYHYHRRDFISFVRQRFRNGLGNARLYVKYSGPRTLLDPLITSILRIVRCAVGGRIGLVPYLFVSGLAQFFGVVVGLSRNRSNDSARR